MEGKRLYRSRTDRMIGGVASGVAAYLNVDPLFVRLAFVLFGLWNGFGVLIYLILWLLLPNADSITTDPRDQVRENVEEMRTAVQDVVDRIRNSLNK